jgi:hypothetical protein
MPAPGNSRRRKFATAILVPLTLALVASLYIEYSAYSAAVAAQAIAESDRIAALRKFGELQANYEDLRRTIGVSASVHDLVIDEISTRLKKIDQGFTAMDERVDKLVGAALTDGQAPELDEIRGHAKRVTALFRSDPKKTLISALERLATTIVNSAQLTTRLSLDYREVRLALEAAGEVAKARGDVQRRAALDARGDLLQEHKKHEEERLIILVKVDELQTAIDKRDTEILSLTAKIRKQEEDFRRNTEIQATLVQELYDAANTIAKEPIAKPREEGQPGRRSPGATTTEAIKLGGAAKAREIKEKQGAATPKND